MLEFQRDRLVNQLEGSLLAKGPAWPLPAFESCSLLVGERPASAFNAPIRAPGIQPAGLQANRELQEAHLLGQLNMVRHEGAPAHWAAATRSRCLPLTPAAAGNRDGALRVSADLVSWTDDAGECGPPADTSDLRPTRKALDLTLAKAADALDCSLLKISRIERGHVGDSKLVTTYRTWLNEQTTAQMAG